MFFKQNALSRTPKTTCGLSVRWELPTTAAREEVINYYHHDESKYSDSYAVL
jgi:hypothetical protein